MESKTRRVKVQPYRDHLICPQCGGEMIATGFHHLLGGTNPPNDQHRCEECGFEGFFSKCYPGIVYGPETAE